MPSPALKCVTMRQENTQIAILVVWEEVGTVYSAGKVTQEMMTDAEGVKVKAKKEAIKSSNADENKVDEKESR